MKHVLTLLAASVSVLAGAQNLTSTTVLIDQEGPLTGYDHIMDLKIYNNSGTTLDLAWNRPTNDMPGSWVSAICDCSLCHDTATSYAGFTDPFDANDSCFVSCHIRDDGSTHGVGTVVMEIYDPNDSANTNLGLTFRYTAWPLGIADAGTHEIRVYPNPSASMIVVDHGDEAAHIRLFSAEGKLLRTISTDGVDASVINMAGLPAGNIIVEVIAADGQVMASSTVTRL